MAIRYKALTELYHETQRSAIAPWHSGRHYFPQPAATTVFPLMSSC